LEFAVLDTDGDLDHESENDLPLATAEQDAATQAETAAPSGGQDVDADKTGPASLADAIAAAVTADPEADAGPETQAAEDEGDKGEKVAEPAPVEASTDEVSKADDDPTDDELKALPPKSAKRVKQLLSQRNTARRERDEFAADAVGYREIRGFMAESQLVDQEVQSLFQVGADLKSNDPERLERALNVLMPLASSLMQQLGKTLPDDLKRDVEGGNLTEDHARELARTRAQARLSREQAARSTEQLDQTRTHQALAANAGQIKSAVSAWEASIRQTDPDFGAKSALMRQAALALVAERGGRPADPVQAVEFAKEAYRRANEIAKSLRPAPKPTRATPDGGSSGTRVGLSAAPKTLEEAILAAARGS
jgi:hypothetical protein